MKTIIRIITGVAFGVIASFVCKALGCDPFTVGLSAGTFGSIGNNLAGVMLNNLNAA